MMSNKVSIEIQVNAIETTKNNYLQRLNEIKSQRTQIEKQINIAG